MQNRIFLRKCARWSIVVEKVLASPRSSCQFFAPRRGAM